MTSLTSSTDNDTYSVTEPVIVSLKQVAAWDIEHLDAPCPIKASVPALQRGLVWSPQQVELLWDSILRGFPIGSLVVSGKLPEPGRDSNSDLEHHLLDGQQRANAIALGFYDPFAGTEVQVRANNSKSILWLDLANELIPDNSTREFLIRVTTLAHPWGYQADDNASRLSAKDARDAVESENKGHEKPKDKPSSLDLRPWRSKAPVPLAWLMNAIGDKQNGIREEDAVWISVRNRLEQEAAKRRWPALALEVLKKGHALAELNTIYLGLRRAAQTQLLVLKTPKDILLSKSRHEKFSRDQNAAISSIEHLFNRLNRLGTPLDGEELAYSMIKAYWPDSATVIEKVATRRLPASRLVSLAVRAALTHRGDAKLARGIGIPRLRAIAKAVSSDEDLYKQRTQIEQFIGRPAFPSGAPSGTEEVRMAKACARVEKWLVFDGERGLPRVLVSSFARGSSDIYLFLLHIADQLGASDSAQDCEWKNLLPGLATLSHWFSKSDKLTIADSLLAAVAGEISPQNVRKGLAAAFEKDLIVPPRRPDELEEFIKLPEDENLKDWGWWKSLIENFSENERADRQSKWWPFLERTVWQRELLLYAQRSYLESRFPLYDPSRKDLWENHNRPWDFDHIHAGFYFWGQQGVYAAFCREWGNCIGNMRAWPFEDNRSDQKDKANEKLSKPEEMKWSLIESEAELDAFSHGNSTRYEPPVAAHALSAAIKARYIRIYRDWYDSTGMSLLLLPKRSPASPGAVPQLAGVP